MSERDHMEFEGRVIKTCGGGFYQVEYDVGSTVAVALCKLGGKLSYNHIRVIPDDIVKIALSPHDTSRGMITFRGR
jgi:translation initiation factor IF-1